MGGRAPHVIERMLAPIAGLAKTAMRSGSKSGVSSATLAKKVSSTNWLTAYVHSTMQSPVSASLSSSSRVARRGAGENGRAAGRRAIGRGAWNAKATLEQHSSATTARRLPMLSMISCSNGCSKIETVWIFWDLRA